MKIAVVGAGVSGLVAARLLVDDHDVHVFEANDHIGGHANTVSVGVKGDAFPVDTGFMVFNERTYPNFCELLRRLGVSWRDSDMSFGVCCERTGLEYQGSSLGGLFAQRRNLFRPRFWQMLAEIVRFNRLARQLVARGDSSDSSPLDYSETLGEFLAAHRFGQAMIDWYLTPMGASIWSVPPGEFLKFPARFVLAFFENHGLLSVRGHYRWKTIVGGSIRYIERLTEGWRERIRTNCPVKSVRRTGSGVLVGFAGGEEQFDAVVLAGHADEMLSVLTDADELEREILGAFPYQRNETVLHTDTSVLPRTRRAWASWNYRIPTEADRPVLLTYNLNRLQGHRASPPLCITLNGSRRLDPNTILARWDYAHPVYSPAALAAQRRRAEINGRNRTYFCGAYWGNGFHEDGVNSALAVGRLFGRQSV